MADLLKKSMAVDAELIEGGGGVFDVEIDGKVVFSKGQLGRFPTPADLTAMLGNE